MREDKTDVVVEKDVAWWLEGVWHNEKQGGAVSFRVRRVALAELVQRRRVEYVYGVGCA
jgi:hypothetical protein